jgi:hypothetical protein
MPAMMTLKRKKTNGRMMNEQRNFILMGCAAVFIASLQAVRDLLQ